MNRKIIIEEHINRRLNQRVTLWEENDGEIICRKFFLKNHRNNGRVDRLNKRNIVFSFTMGEVMESSLEDVINRVKEEYE